MSNLLHFNKYEFKSASSTTPVDRLARTIEWINAKHTLEGDFGIYHLCERIAAVIGKTYAERGDAYEISDDIALMMVRDLLLALDANIIERNCHKRLKSLLSRANPEWLYVGQDHARRVSFLCEMKS